MNTLLPSSGTVIRLGGTAVALVALTAGFHFWTSQGTGEVFTKSWRIGVRAEAPLAITSPGGTVTGIVPEILRKAASRKGLRCVFVPISGDPLAALRNNEIDLWPAAAEAAGQGLFVGKPWLSLRLSLVSRADLHATDLADLGRQRLAVADKAVWEGIPVRKRPASVRLIETSARREALTALCKGSAEATLIEHPLLEPLLLERPPECNTVRLKVAPLPGLERRLHIVSRPQAQKAVEALESEMADMIADGGFARAAAAWPVSAGMTGTLEQSAAASSPAVFLGGCIVVLVAIVIAMSIRQRPPATSVDPLADITVPPPPVPEPVPEPPPAIPEPEPPPVEPVQKVTVLREPTEPRKLAPISCNLEATLRQSLELARLASATSDRQSVFSLEPGLPSRVDCLEETLRHELSAELTRAFLSSDGQGISLRARMSEAGNGMVCIDVAVNGDAAVESQTRELPLAAPSASGHPKVELRTAMPKQRGGRAAPRQPRVLLVEDNPLNRASARRLIADMGYEVAVASDGEAALDTLTREKFDLLLVDYLMPGLSGPETVRAFRRTEAGSRVPVVLLLVGQDPAHRRFGAEAGADDFLEKPLTPYSLSCSLKRWISAN